MVSDANQSFQVKKKKLLKSTDYFYRVIMQSSKVKKRRNEPGDKTPPRDGSGTTTNQAASGSLSNRAMGENKMAGFLAAFKRALKKEPSESKDSSMTEENKSMV